MPSGLPRISTSPALPEARRTVGRRSRHVLGAYRRAGARAVLDDERLAALTLVGQHAVVREHLDAGQRDPIHLRSVAAAGGCSRYYLHLPDSDGTHDRHRGQRRRDRVERQVGCRPHRPQDRPGLEQPEQARRPDGTADHHCRGGQRQVLDHMNALDGQGQPQALSQARITPAG